MDIAVVKELLTVVAMVTGLEAPADGVEIKLVKDKDELRTICETTRRAVDACFRSNSGDPAIYIWSFYKSPRVAARTAGIWAHELTHYAQWYNGAFETFPCQRYGEYQAYKVQNRVLRLGRVHTLPYRKIEALAECPD